MNKRLAVTVKGKEKDWCFIFTGDPQYLDEWRADGLEVDEVVNIVPDWVAAIGMTRAWCKMQDIINLKWLRV